MESLLEVQRNCHEERERCIELMVVESLTEKRSVGFIFQHSFVTYLKNFQQKEKINSDQRIKSLVDVSLPFVKLNCYILFSGTKMLHKNLLKYTRTTTENAKKKSKRSLVQMNLQSFTLA